MSLLDRKATPIPQIPKGSPNMQKQAQPGLQEAFGQLDKASLPWELSKGVLPLPLAKGHIVVPISIPKHMLASRLPQYGLLHISKSILASWPLAPPSLP